MVLVRDAPEVTRLPENSRRTAIGWAVVSCLIFALAAVAEALVFQENGPPGTRFRGNDLPKLAGW